MTEDELLDKINRDIAICKSEQDAEENLGVMPDYFKELPMKEEIAEKREKKSSNNWWSIPPTRKMKAEEIIEEDRQYLEELAF